MTMRIGARSIWRAADGRTLDGGSRRVSGKCAQMVVSDANNSAADAQQIENRMKRIAIDRMGRSGRRRRTTGVLNANVRAMRSEDHLHGG